MICFRNKPTDNQMYFPNWRYRSPDSTTSVSKFISSSEEYPIVGCTSQQLILLHKWTNSLRIVTSVRDSLNEISVSLLLRSQRRREKENSPRIFLTDLWECSHFVAHSQMEFRLIPVPCELLGNYLLWNEIFPMVQRSYLRSPSK